MSFDVTVKNYYEFEISESGAFAVIIHGDEDHVLSCETGFNWDDDSGVIIYMGYTVIDKQEGPFFYDCPYC